MGADFPQMDLNVAFQSPMKISLFKDKIKNVEEQSLVVYNLKCRECGVEYIGKTERILCHRLKEHRYNTNSACMQHVDGGACSMHMA